jgi:arylsulfatase
VKPKTKIKSKSNIMKRKLITNSSSLLTASAALVWAVAQAADKKPNILIISGDDLGYGNPGCYDRGMMG